MQNNGVAHCYGGSVKRKLGPSGKGFQRATSGRHKGIDLSQSLCREV